MSQPGLSPSERSAINTGRWFSSLSPSVRHDLLRHARLRRYAPGELISARGSISSEWFACASGAVRVGSSGITGKQIALTYIQPGVWFGDPGLFDGGCCAHDVHAHEQSTLLVVTRAELETLLVRHTELCAAVMRLQARHIRELYEAIEEANTLPLGARLAKQLVSLTRRHGVPVGHKGGAIRIGLNLCQKDLAELIGASRQRVNSVLKEMERSGIIQLERLSVVVYNTDALKAMSAR